jgi:hypothetical protein
MTGLVFPFMLVACLCFLGAVFQYNPNPPNPSPWYGYGRLISLGLFFYVAAEAIVHYKG